MHNRIERLLDDFPDLQAIAFNGSAAAAAGRRSILTSTAVTLIDLPSSSAANTRPFDEKVRAWAELARFAGP